MTVISGAAHSIANAARARQMRKEKAAPEAPLLKLANLET